MTTLMWIGVGVAVLLAALLLARARMAVGAERRDALPPSQAWTANGLGDMTSVRLARADLKAIREDIQNLHVIREDIRRVGDLLERLLEEALAGEQPRVDPPRARPGAGSGRDAFRDPVRDTSPEPLPIQGATWPPNTRDPDLRVQHDEFVWGSDPTPRSPAPADPSWSAPAHEPSPQAQPVEARNDAVVRSDRHPPEAWLERKSEVWLNAKVTFTDAALQRWSTFFDWERREPGARYQATRPATVTSSGSLASKGMARPI